MKRLTLKIALSFQDIDEVLIRRSSTLLLGTDLRKYQGVWILDNKDSEQDDQPYQEAKYGFELICGSDIALYPYSGKAC